MEDLMEEANDIQDVLSRSYETDTIDESDLEAGLIYYLKINFKLNKSFL